MYLDANNIYGWAMSQPLPYRNFRWLELDREMSEWLEYINKKVESTGKIYEVDLEYPDELRHLHNDYPCAAEKIKVTRDAF